MLRSARALLLGWLVCLLLSPLARVAAQAGEAGQRAAAEFDTGVQAYKQGDYARAAQAFLSADTLSPSAAALSNALAAARRAGLPLLIARAAERSLARSTTSEADRKSAESALAESRPMLARLEIACSAAECAPSIDGVPGAVHGSYALPGEHRISAEGHLAEVVRCEAGSACQVALKALPASPPRAAVPPVASLAVEPAVQRATDDGASKAKHPRRRKRAPFAVFVSSGAGALVLLSLATWQGVTALHAKSGYGKQPPEDRHWSDVTRPAHRSDFLLAGGIVLAGAALASAIWWVDWDAYSRSQLSLLPEGGATLTTRRRF